MPAPEYIDIRFLRYFEKYAGKRGAGKPRCGACLFPLVTGATAWHFDADQDLSQTSLGCSGREEFQASAARGCTYCAGILKLASGRGAIQLRLQPGSCWRTITVTKQDRTREDFHFLVPPDKFHEDLNGGTNAICRGFGAASIQCTAENEVLDKARLWWDWCSREHDCRMGPCCYTPTRLLRLDHSLDEASTVIRLVEDITEPVEYVALSHRWSEETKAVSLLNSNRRGRIEKGIQRTGLPRLMQDTMQVLRRFEIEYLWIDCLCIIQDDNDDWKREAASMASVYKNAAFTISAINCLGSSESLFSDPHQPLAAGFVGELPGDIPVYIEQHTPHPFHYPKGDFKTTIRHSQSYRDDYTGSRIIDRDSKSLLSRGWVYQEVLLSPRTLYFLANELMWRCRANTVCQCARYDLDINTPGVSDLKSVMYRGDTLYYSERGCKPVASRDWVSIVEDYSSKGLTYPQDRLPGLAGIAQEFASAKGWTYICGLWQEDLSQTFGWTSLGGPVTHRPKSSLPTWSWASIGTSVHINIVCSHELVFESCHVTYKDRGSPYLGDVEEAVLNVRGDVFPAKLVPPSRLVRSNNYLAPPLDRQWGVSICSSVVVTFGPDCILPETSTIPDEDVLCLILHPGDKEYLVSFRCLVLRGVGHRADQYKRVQRLGMIRIPEDEKPGDWRTRWGVSTRRLALV